MKILMVFFLLCSCSVKQETQRGSQAIKVPEDSAITFLNQVNASVISTTSSLAFDFQNFENFIDFMNKNPGHKDIVRILFEERFQQILFSKFSIENEFLNNGNYRFKYFYNPELTVEGFFDDKKELEIRYKNYFFEGTVRSEKICYLFTGDSLLPC